MHICMTVTTLRPTVRNIYMTVRTRIITTPRLVSTTSVTTMKDKRYIERRISHRQSLPLYFSDQSKYQSYPSLDLVTQLIQDWYLFQETRQPQREHATLLVVYQTALLVFRTETTNSLPTANPVSRTVTLCS